MDHPSLEEAISRHLIDGSQKWEQFFQGKLFMVRTGGGFSEYGFVYEGKIWYGEEKEGSDVYYSEGTVENILPVFINPATTFHVSNLDEKMTEVMKKKEEGFLISDGSGTFNFETRTKSIHTSQYEGEQPSVMEMFELGEHLAWLILEPVEWKYVQV